MSHELPNSRVLVLELGNSGDLSSLTKSFYNRKLFHLHQNYFDSSDRYKKNWMNNMSESLILFYFNQIINSLDYLKNMNLLHKDLKLENLIINSMNQMKLADFALSTQVPTRGTYELSYAGTSVYMPPEIVGKTLKFIDIKEAFKQDYFSLGVILYKMLTGKYLVEAKSVKNGEKMVDLYELNAILDNISENGFDPNIIPNIDLQNFLKGLLNKNIKDRMNIKEIKSHNWIKKNEDRIKLLYDINQNDALKCVLELQKADYIEKLNNRKFISTEQIRYETIEHSKIIINNKLIIKTSNLAKAIKSHRINKFKN